VKNRQLNFEGGETGTSVAIASATLLLSLCVALLMPLFSASAQSGRIPSSPQSKPSPVLTPPAKPVDVSEATPNRPVHIDADVYKLVFPTYYEGSILKGKPYQLSSSANQNFMKVLDEACTQGFRAVSMVGAFPIAIVKRGESRFEYALFQGVGPFWTKVGFEASYSLLSKQGFHLIDEFLDRRSCKDMTPDEPSSYPLCIDTYMFLVEKGVNEPVKEQRLAFTGPSFSEKTATALNKQIGDRLAEGYYPTFLLSKFEILLERTGNGDERSVDKSDVKVLASGSRDDIATQVNDMAKQGYRLSMVNNKIALMHRNHANATTTSYVWLDATKQDFETRLTQLQEQDAIYRMAYPSDQGVRNRLIFEQKAVGDSTKREYKVLKFELSYTADAANQHITADLKPDSKETMRLLNRMVNEGYVACELFREGPAPGGYSVLLMLSK